MARSRICDRQLRLFPRIQPDPADAVHRLGQRQQTVARLVELHCPQPAGFWVTSACRWHEVQRLNRSRHVAAGGPHTRHPECSGSHIVRVGAGTDLIEPLSDGSLTPALAGQGQR